MVSGTGTDAGASSRRVIDQVPEGLWDPSTVSSWNQSCSVMKSTCWVQGMPQIRYAIGNHAYFMTRHPLSINTTPNSVRIIAHPCTNWFCPGQMP